MGNILILLEKVTNGNCYQSYSYCADDELRLPTINYEENQNLTFVVKRPGETSAPTETKDLSELKEKISPAPPLFQYFLDGSRRTYKVDDIELNRRIFPIMAGQIGVACCERQSPSQIKCNELENNLVLALPSEANPEIRNPDLFLNSLKDKVNQLEGVQTAGVKFSSIISYSSKVDSNTGDKYEHKGIAAIQDEMINAEKKVVASLTAKNLLSEERYLLKDGSLQYKPMRTGEYKELSKIKNNYRWVIGVSKLFNPEFSKDKRGKSNAAILAKLPLYHRTPAYMHEHDIEQRERLGDYRFSIWYVRIRDFKYSESPFAGIVKVEKILITESENENGLESDLVDIISTNIINERNPVCYGKDTRWANHLYPIYLTELFLKSKYLSDLHFINLF